MVVVEFLVNNPMLVLALLAVIILFIVWLRQPKPPKPLPQLKGIKGEAAATLAYHLLIVRCTLGGVTQKREVVLAAVQRLYAMHGRDEPDLEPACQRLQELGYISIVDGKVVLAEAFLKKFGERPPIIYPAQK